MSENHEQLIVNPFVSYELETVKIIKDYSDLQNKGEISADKFEKEKDKTLKTRVYENLKINKIKPKKNIFYILAGIWILYVGIFALITNIKSIFDFAFTDLFVVICGIIVGMSTLRLGIAYLIRKDKAIAVYSFVFSLINIADFILNADVSNISRTIFFGCYYLSYIVIGIAFILKSQKLSTVACAIIAAVLNFSYIAYCVYINFQVVGTGELVVVVATFLMEFVLVGLFPILAFSIKDKMSKKGKQKLETMKFTLLEANNLIQEYTSLLDSGAISQQDFDNKKEYILNRMQ